MSMNVTAYSSTAASNTNSASGSNQSGLQDVLQALFNQADGNGDGAISGDEFASLMKHTSGAGAASAATQTSDLFKQIDSDGDGQISLTEFKKFAGGLFEKMAQGASGGDSAASSACGAFCVNSVSVSVTTVTLSESGSTDGSDMSAAVQSALKLAQALSSYGSHKHHHGGDSLAQLFGQMDSNGDGSLSSDEFALALKGSAGGVTA